MQYDLKIGIGGMVPHPMAGFGGVKLFFLAWQESTL